MKNLIILIALFFAVGALSAQGPGMGGGRGGHGGSRLTEEQRTEMTALRDSLITAGATTEELHEAMTALLASWGLESMQHGGRGGFGGPQLTEEQRTEMTALRDSLITAGATTDELHEAMTVLLASWGLAPMGHPGGRGGFGGLQLTEEQRTEMTALRDSLLAAGVTPEEMHLAMTDLLTSWGLEPGMGQFRGQAGMLNLTEDQRDQLHDLVYGMREAGATSSEIHTAVTDLLTEWGIEQQWNQNGGRARRDRAYKQRRVDQVYNQPNPFNPSTRIAYNLTEASSVSIAIYDLQGHLVRSYKQGYQPVGSYAVMWDGTLGSGQPAPSGVYFYRINAGNEVTTQRMLLMK